jgi:protein TonB
VTDVIVARSRQPEGLKTMLVWSIAGHVLLLAAALFTGLRVDDAPQEPVMTISLGGAPGPRTGGMTQIGARAVQAPAIEAPRPPVPSPPAPTPPRMTLPDPRSRPREQPRPQQAPPEASARRPSTGPQPTHGSALVDTGVPRGQGFGLSSAGGVGGPVQLEVGDFCCPDYLAQVVAIIQGSWDQNHGVVGSTTVRFTITRSGAVQAPQVSKPSGFIALDSSAMRAVQLARLPPLPSGYQHATLPISVRFDYQ